jgi:XTP/dITP diphosphohydrolase
MSAEATLLFASHNAGKATEIRSMLGDRFRVITLDEAGIHQDIPETGSTLEENAIIKAEYGAQISRLPCFGDDSGLLVDALQGAPGVYSARYAGEPSNSEANIRKLLSEMRNVENRTAVFRTVIAICRAGEVLLFQGECKGRITSEPHGSSGFGYDPVFIPEGASRTFGEMTLAEKNVFSHRARAFEAFLDYLGQRVDTQIL